MNRDLSRRYLEMIGVISVDFGMDGWVVTRRRNTKSGGVIVSTVQPRDNNGSLCLVMSVNGSPKIFSLGRFVYAWHMADVPGDMEVCYIDGNPKNAALDNLVLLDQKAAYRMKRRTEEEKARDAEARSSAAVQYQKEAKRKRG